MPDHLLTLIKLGKEHRNEMSSKEYPKTKRIKSLTKYFIYQSWGGSLSFL